MNKPSNRHLVFYPYLCLRCGLKQLRGSSAKRCELAKCGGRLLQTSRKPQTKLKAV